MKETGSAFPMQVYNTTKEKIIASDVGVASGLLSRLAGLLGTPGLPPGGGLWISPCRAVHSFGMSYPFDALFLDAGLRVVAAYPSFPKNRLTRLVPGARGVLELPAGTIWRTGTGKGDRISFRRAKPAGRAARPVTSS